MLACGFPVFELTDNFRLMEKANALAENILIELYVGLQLNGKSVQMQHVCILHNYFE